MNTRIHPETGEILTRGVRTETLTYKGFSMTFDMPGWYPEGSNEGVHDGEDMKVSDRALHQLKAQATSLLSPEEIRKIRKSLHLTQAKAGDIIGGGPKAFQKYESGDLLPSKAISNLLRVLSNYPKALDELSKVSYPTKLEDVG